MGIRTVVAATSLALLLPGLALSPATASAVPAERAAKAVRVTMRDLPSTSEVGRKVAVSGTATPTGKARTGRVKVAVQRRYGAGAWRTVATTRTDRRGRYAARVALTQGGPTSFRVRRAGGATSRVESLAVYQWLDLIDQPHLLTADWAELRRPTVIGGRTFPNSYQFPSGSGIVLAKPGGLCTTFEVWAGFLDSQRSQVPDGSALSLEGQTFTSTRFSDRVTLAVGVGAAQRFTLDLNGWTYFQLATARTAMTSLTASAVLASPRLRCNAAALPEVSKAELPPAPPRLGGVGGPP